jgi:catecholate siderophore receptor
MKAKSLSNVLLQTARAGSLACTVAMPLISMAKEDIKLLPDVIVKANKESVNYIPSSGSSMPMMSRNIIDNPQTVTAISKDLMKDQGVTSTAGALRNVGGLTLAAGEGGNQGDNLYIRGFAARGDFYLDGIRDFGNYTRDPFNLEKIEVIKGPSGTVAGRGSTGGIISQESKKASAKKITDLSFTIGSDSTRRVTADINRKIEGMEGAAFRLNLMTHDANVAGRDVVNNKRTGFAPTVSFGMGTPTRSSISYLYQSENNIPDFGVPMVGTRPANVDRTNYYGFANGINFLKTTVNMLTGKVEHDFSEQTKVEQVVRFAKNERQMMATGPRVNGVNPTTVSRSQQAVDSTESMVDARTTLTHNFTTGGIKHELTSGFELIKETSAPKRFSYSGVPTADFLNPNSSQMFAGTGALNSDMDITVNTQAFFIGDTIAINKKLDVILGARVDRYNVDYRGINASNAVATINRTDYMPSVRGSVVYKPKENSSVYLNYATSYTPVTDFGFVNLASMVDIAPEKNQNLELGTKWGLFDNKLQAVFAIFDTTKLNSRVVDPANVTQTILAGKQRVQGFEAQLNGDVTEKLQVFTNYTFMDAKIVESTSAATAPRVGSQMPGAPKHTFNFWGTYKMVPKFHIGFGATALSNRATMLTPNSSTTGAREVPGYVTYNAMAKYIVNPKLDFQLNVYNLTNKYYFDTIYPAHAVPGAGMYGLLTMNVKID